MERWWNFQALPLLATPRWADASCVGIKYRRVSARILASHFHNKLSLSGGCGGVSLQGYKPFSVLDVFDWSDLKIVNHCKPFTIWTSPRNTQCLLSSTTNAIQAFMRMQHTLRDSGLNQPVGKRRQEGWAGTSVHLARAAILHPWIEETRAQTWREPRVHFEWSFPAAKAKGMNHCPPTV